MNKTIIWIGVAVLVLYLLKPSKKKVGNQVINHGPGQRTEAELELFAEEPDGGGITSHSFGFGPAYGQGENVQQTVQFQGGATVNPILFQQHPNVEIDEVSGVVRINNDPAKFIAPNTGDNPSYYEFSKENGLGL
jgi:hypothetical protein